jgi:hypothetical protein
LENKANQNIAGTKTNKIQSGWRGRRSGHREAGKGGTAAGAGGWVCCDVRTEDFFSIYRLPVRVGTVACTTNVICTVRSRSRQGGVFRTAEPILHPFPYYLQLVEYPCVATVFMSLSIVISTLKYVVSLLQQHHKSHFKKNHTI